MRAQLADVDLVLLDLKLQVMERLQGFREPRIAVDHGRHSAKTGEAFVCSQSTHANPALPWHNHEVHVIKVPHSLGWGRSRPDELEVTDLDDDCPVFLVLSALVLGYRNLFKRIPMLPEAREMPAHGRVKRRRFPRERNE